MLSWFLGRAGQICSGWFTDRFTGLHGIGIGFGIGICSVWFTDHFTGLHGVGIRIGQICSCWFTDRFTVCTSLSIRFPNPVLFTSLIRVCVPFNIFVLSLI